MAKRKRASNDLQKTTR